MVRATKVPSKINSQNSSLFSALYKVCKLINKSINNNKLYVIEIYDNQAYIRFGKTFTAGHYGKRTVMT